MRSPSGMCLPQYRGIRMTYGIYLNAYDDCLYESRTNAYLQCLHNSAGIGTAGFN